ncbi:MAG: YraN family protein [Deltaproteobacteria bacterium]|nr:YraN family protein [Deltaproteobacteria bacterium]
MDRAAIGKRGEIEAARFLESRGYKVLEQIDLVARDGHTVVFIEVKTRGSDRFGAPTASVDAKKQKKILLTSQFYIESNRLFDSDLRFDVVGIEINGGKLAFELVKNAFEATEG